jgi:hypothetical protein
VRRCLRPGVRQIQHGGRQPVEPEMVDSVVHVAAATFAPHQTRSHEGLQMIADEVALQPDGLREGHGAKTRRTRRDEAAIERQSYLLSQRRQGHGEGVVVHIDKILDAETVR